MKFDITGEFIFKIGGSSEDIFTLPSTVFVKNEHIYVGDLETGVIYKFNKYGKKIASTSKEQKGSCEIVDSIFVTENEMVIATDWQNNRIHVYDEKLKFLNSYEKDLLQPTGIFYKDQKIYVCDSMNGLMRIFKANDIFPSINFDRVTETINTDHKKIIFDAVNAQKMYRINSQIDEQIKEIQYKEIKKSNDINDEDKNSKVLKEEKKDMIPLNKIVQIISLPLFNSSAKVYETKHIFLILNNSMFLKNRWNSLKTSLISFLKKTDESIGIRIITADEDIRHTKSYRKDEAIKKIDNISFLERTDLFGLIYNTIEYIKGEKNVNCIIITDNFETNSLYSINDIKNIYTKSSVEFFILTYLLKKEMSILKELSSALNAKLYSVKDDIFEIDYK